MAMVRLERAGKRYGDVVALADVDRNVLEQARASFGSTPKIHDDYRDLLKDKKVSEDDARRAEQNMQKMTDNYIAVIDKKTGALIEHKLDGAFLQWQKNRIDARKWTAMKLKPKKYGDKIALGGDGDAPPIKTEDTGSSRLFELIKAMEMTKRAG